MNISAVIYLPKLSSNLREKEEFCIIHESKTCALPAEN